MRGKVSGAEVEDEASVSDRVAGPEKEGGTIGAREPKGDSTGAGLLSDFDIQQRSQGFVGSFHHLGRSFDTPLVQLKVHQGFDQILS